MDLELITSTIIQSGTYCVGAQDVEVSCLEPTR